jgi:hypothetical protein
MTTTAERLARDEIDLEDEADAAFGSGIEIGALNAEINEARRMLSVFASHAAQAKPYGAWCLLPLGLPVRETLQRLAEYPVEKEPADAHQFFVNTLNARLERARANAEMESSDVIKH